MHLNPFVHLKVHTEYSIQDSIIRVDHLIQSVKTQGMQAVAVTDQSNLFALIKFYQKALSAQIKPIIAADLILYEQNKKYAITAYCQNLTGYRHLTQLISRAYIEGQVNHQPTIRWEWLKEKNNGLLILSSATKGDIALALSSGNAALAEKYLSRWLSVFNDRYYLELQRTGRAGEERYISAAITLATKHHVPVVATNAVCFLSRNDFEAHEARVCIHSGDIMHDPKRPRHYRDTQYLRSPEAMISLFSDIPEAIKNTVEISKRCTVTLELGRVFLPHFPLPKGDTLKDHLAQKTLEGLNAYFHKINSITEAQQAKYQKRIDLELKVINDMGFPGYFLIVADFVGWAKSHDIPVGPGRGSGAGSLVAFCLGITELDPIMHGLLFERFLNPERVSMPDFDIDFCMDRRDEVISYVANRYGHTAVSQIITYGTMAAKAVVRDVGRVLGMPYAYVDKIAKLIPFELGMTLHKALAQEEALAERYHEEEEVHNLIHLAMKLEGIVRNAGKHAGGVVIAPTQLTDFTPLYCESDSKNTLTQFDKEDVESVGLIKFDFLGLRTLTIIHQAQKTINKRLLANGQSTIDVRKIPLDDESTYLLLRRGQTTAIFQLESHGMKKLIHRLQPDRFQDMTALVALFRPGPLQSGMVDTYIDRKHGRVAVEYAHSQLKPILEETNGVILYQEQVMEIARVLAGYSLGEADLLRRAMSKKRPEEMAEQRAIFIKGAEQRGLSKQKSGYIFDLMEKFAGYGFNKSHSAAYAFISYQTAWLKTHYLAEFMAAVLSSDMDNTDKLMTFLSECKHQKLTVNKPNINLSDYTFFVNEKESIEYGLGAIKGVGESAAKNLTEERNSHGLYQDLFDFCRRVDLRKLNKRVISALIASGAMDCFKQSRALLTATLETALKSADRYQHDQAVGQVYLFDTLMTEQTVASMPQASPVTPWSRATCLQAEKEVLGYYLSGHPLETHQREFKQLQTISISALDHVSQKNVCLAGLIADLRLIHTKRGSLMAVMTLEDATGKIDVTIFSALYASSAQYLKKDQVLLIRGNIEEDPHTEKKRVLAESLKTLDQIRNHSAKRLLITIKHQQVDALIEALPSLLTPYCDGPCPVIFAYQSRARSVELQLGKAWHIRPEETLLSELRELCGEEAITLEYNAETDILAG